MSVKSMLPIIGVGSAAALIGLVASRRSASHVVANPTPARTQRPSGITVRRSGDDSSSGELDEPPTAPHGLPQGFWDATPESTSDGSDGSGGVDSTTTRYAPEREDPNERDGLTADWLARATQAPALEDAAEDDYDDPAEIAADSLSMISDASRHAAIQADDDDVDTLSER
jgi:hypothetical protein